MDTAEQKKDGWKHSKPNNLIRVPTEVGTDDFFKKWCVFLRPFVSLTDREIDVVASLLRQRYELSNAISDQALLDSMMMSDSIKKKTMRECGMTSQYFYVVMSSLRKNKIITESGINPRLIPNIRKDESGAFQLLILFKGDDNKKIEE